ncbi:MAG: molybdopterin-dependent oxidoreductase, partial [Planctomycetes bacterium]|nr:molybdopterin-dependent oxidoreductase [Planctomycetota bacterium]
MAEIPKNRLDTLANFGPRLQYNQGATIKPGMKIDKLVDTHCCFCGQQCGIILKVAKNQVVGFEPRYDFPFNKGLLCPKGVKRYLQGGHPDRLTTALKKDESAVGGFRNYAYDDAIKEVAAKIKKIQDEHGPDSVGVLSGASLTTEKAYLMGKFARLGLQTPYIDYNGRLCMVSAASANKKAFGVDRAANPWEDIVGTDV